MPELRFRELVCRSPRGDALPVDAEAWRGACRPAPGADHDGGNDRDVVGIPKASANCPAMVSLLRMGHACRWSCRAWTSNVSEILAGQSCDGVPVAWQERRSLFRAVHEASGGVRSAHRPSKEHGWRSGSACRHDTRRMRRFSLMPRFMNFPLRRGWMKCLPGYLRAVRCSRSSSLCRQGFD